jgi:hypothetical protein
MLDPLGMVMEVGRPPLGFLVIFSGVDVEERRRAAQIPDLLLGHDVHPDAIQQLQNRLSAGHQQRLDVGDAALGVDGAKRLASLTDGREGYVIAPGGFQQPVQNRPVEKRKIDPQHQTPIEPGVPEPRENSSQRTRLADLVGTDRNMKQGKDLGRAYDESFLDMRLEEVDGPVHQPATAQGEEGLVASHPLAATPGEDETAEPIAGFHRPHLPCLDALIVPSSYHTGRDGA